MLPGGARGCASRAGSGESAPWRSDLPRPHQSGTGSLIIPTVCGHRPAVRGKGRHVKSALIAAVVSAVIASTTATAATIVITSKNIKNGTIQTVDISAKAKRALKGNRGPRGFQGARGAPGAAGATGPAGPQGPPGVQSLTAVGISTTVSPGSFGTVTATCPAGQRPVSGGFLFAGITTASNRTTTGWLANGVNDLATPQELTVFAYCSPHITG
jgi:hypothetical protein